MLTGLSEEKKSSPGLASSRQTITNVIRPVFAQHKAELQRAGHWPPGLAHDGWDFWPGGGGEGRGEAGGGQEGRLEEQGWGSLLNEKWDHMNCNVPADFKSHDSIAFASCSRRNH